MWSIARPRAPARFGSDGFLSCCASGAPLFVIQRVRDRSIWSFYLRRGACPVAGAPHIARIDRSLLCGTTQPNHGIAGRGRHLLVGMDTEPLLEYQHEDNGIV